MLAGSHPERDSSPVLVAPATAGEVNRVRAVLAPKACFSIEDSHFEFDSSFVLPLGLTFDAEPLKKLMDKHPGSKLSVFGHTDPVGKDDFNKVLSGRRAQAIFGLLVRDVGLWKDLYFHHDTHGKDPWGVRSVQIMLNRVGPTKAGRADGVLDSPTKQALKDFEDGNNLPAKGFNQNGEIASGTFEVLARQYMDGICTDDDNNQFQLTPDDFIAGGKGKDGKGDLQGCGEFNPLMIFSKDEKAFFDREENKQERNSENQINRRIMVLLYPPGTKVLPEKWPCPTVKEGVAGCILRFHSNFKERRANADDRREHKDEKTDPAMVGTFACRFYDRQSSDSPCEGPVVIDTSLAGTRVPTLFTLRRTFPKPSCLPVLREIAQRAGNDPTLHVIIMGHTDTSGNDDTNAKVSRARAAAVSALLSGDKTFFRERFRTADPLEVWSWEEIQWMLSALEADGDPFYAGLIDGHRGDATLTATESFQIANDLRVNRRVDEDTLTKLIDQYLALVGAKRPAASQIEIVGGGSWHKPLSFGPDSKFLEGPDFDQEGFLGFRRVEVFLSAQPIQPPTSQCPPTRHDNCPVYKAWCTKTEETLKADPPFTFQIRVVDAANMPVAGATAKLTRHTPDGEEVDEGSFTSSDFGLIRLTQQPGVYVMKVSSQDQDQTISFFLHPDEVGGVTVRMPGVQDRLLFKNLGR